jgi:hypothetical protein
VDVIPLSGQYRQSQLNFEAEARLLASGWPTVMASDLFAVHRCVVTGIVRSQPEFTLRAGFEL